MNGIVDWDVFAYKFRGNQQKAFEKLAYHMFCRKFHKEGGVPSFYNQKHIETNPIKTSDGTIIGFQAKYFETPSINSHQKTELIKAIKGASKTYPEISSLYFYVSRSFADSSKEGNLKTVTQVEIENEAKKQGIELVWVLPSEFEMILNQPGMEDLWEYFFGEDAKRDNYLGYFEKGIINTGTMNQTGDIIGGDKIVNYYGNSGDSPISEDELAEQIRDKIDKVKRDSLFPWFKRNIKYYEAFPTLFIYPMLDTGRKAISFVDLKTLTNENLAIIGDAGAGKTTLLRYFFAFCKHKGYECILLTAEEARDQDGIFDQMLEFARKTNRKRLLFCIDGIDEAFIDDFNSYRRFINKIKSARNSNFWLGCRTDFYRRYSNERTDFYETDCALKPWDPDQADWFIQAYAAIIEKPNLQEKIEQLLGMGPDVPRMKTNPFQLALLVFLAESDDTNPITGVYDLYEKFLNKWFEHELLHGRCRDNTAIILQSLRCAAGKIYAGEDFVFEDVANNNTAVSELLITYKKDIIGNPIANKFYHRSLAAFLLAQNVVEAMQRDDVERLKELLRHKLKDDVTNFIGSCFATLSANNKEVIKKNLIKFYSATQENDDNLSVKEQTIYYLTRLGVNVDNFLLNIVQSNPRNRIMKLTLAYGCVLSENLLLRRYALEYAKSLCDNSENAITNRAWTVVYFGDVIAESEDAKNIDPYTYRDTIKGSWRNARNARSARFTREKPRLKDYRFRLFDIPLFYSFLKDRGWDELSEKEMNILEDVTFPDNIFTSEEIVFLEQTRKELVLEYRKRLSGETGEGNKHGEDKGVAILPEI